MVTPRKYIKNTAILSKLFFFEKRENRYEVYYFSDYFYVYDIAEDTLLEFLADEPMNKQLSKELVKSFKELQSAGDAGFTRDYY